MDETIKDLTEEILKERNSNKNKLIEPKIVKIC